MPSIKRLATQNGNAVERRFCITSLSVDRMLKNPASWQPIDFDLLPEPRDTDTVCVILPTLESLESFIRSNEQQHPFACEGTGVAGTETYLKEHEWIFGATKDAVIRTLLRWGRSPIQCEYYEWATLDPNDHENYFLDRDAARSEAISQGKWSIKDERDSQMLSRTTYRGWWRLTNLPGAIESFEWFSPDPKREELIDPSMEKPDAERILLVQTFDDWMRSQDFEVKVHDRTSLQRDIEYWRRERSSGKGYYGEENV